MRQLAPTAGARFLLEREACARDQSSADYGASIHTPEAAFRYRLTLSLDQPPALSADPDPAPAELEATLTAVARQVARQAGKAHADGRPAWPRRVLRWKGPGRGG